MALSIVSRTLRRGLATVAKSEQTLVLAAESMQPLAAAAVTHANSIAPGRAVLGHVAWNRFPDGTPNIFINDAPELSQYRKVAVLGCLHDPKDIFEQISLLYSLPAYGARALQLVLPFYPTGTMERVLKEGEVATAKTLAQMISNTPQCRGSGALELVTWDLHTLQNRFYFGDNVAVSMRSAIPLLRQAFDGIQEGDICIGFPDAGAEKRFEKSFEGLYPITVCDKKRGDNGERIMSVRPGGGHEGRHVVIVDDLIQSGGTLKTCRDALLEAGATSVSAFSTHAVFPGDGWKKFAQPNPETGATWNNIFLTDSVAPKVQEIQGDAGDASPFVVLSLDKMIGAELLS